MGLEGIKDLRRRGVSSTIVLYAIRDLKGAKRQEVMVVKRHSAAETEQSFSKKEDI